MRTLTILAAVAVALLATAGCGGVSEKDLVGKWTGKVTLSEEDKKNPMAAMMENMSIDLELKADKTFTMNMMIPVEGTWTYADKTVKLNATKVMGMDANQGGQNEEPLELTVVDAKKMVAKEQKGSTESPPMTFTKA